MAFPTNGLGPGKPGSLGTKLGNLADSGNPVAIGLANDPDQDEKDDIMQRQVGSFTAAGLQYLLIGALWDGAMTE